MRFDLCDYHGPDGEQGCRALLVIPDGYNFDMNE